MQKSQKTRPEFQEVGARYVLQRTEAQRFADRRRTAATARSLSPLFDELAGNVPGRLAFAARTNETFQGEAGSGELTAWAARAGSLVSWYPKDEGSLGRMTSGWQIAEVLPTPVGASPLQGWWLVAIPDKGEAIRAIKARHPHAAIRVNSEADAELLAKYDVRDGKIFVLVEGS